MNAKKLSAIAKRFFSSDLKALYKAGYFNDGNELTDNGRDMLEVLVLEKFMSALVKEAKKEIDNKKKNGNDDD